MRSPPRPPTHLDVVAPAAGQLDRRLAALHARVHGQHLRVGFEQNSQPEIGGVQAQRGCAHSTITCGWAGGQNSTPVTGCSFNRRPCGVWCTGRAGGMPATCWEVQEGCGGQPAVCSHSTPCHKVQHSLRTRSSPRPSTPPAFHFFRLVVAKKPGNALLVALAQRSRKPPGMPDKTTKNNPTLS